MGQVLGSHRLYQPPSSRGTNPQLFAKYIGRDGPLGSRPMQRVLFFRPWHQLVFQIKLNDRSAAYRVGRAATRHLKRFLSSFELQQKVRSDYWWRVPIRSVRYSEVWPVLWLSVARASR